MELQIILFAFIATVCTTFVGSVWFSPLLFGDVWMRQVYGLKDRMRMSSSNMMIIFAANILLEFMTALIFRACLEFAGITTPGSIFGFGFLVFVGFMLPVLAGDILWRKGSPQLFAISAGHRLVSLMIVCILASIWQ